SPRFPGSGCLFLWEASRYDELAGASGLVKGRCWGLARSWPSPRPVTIGMAADSDAAIRGPSRVDATPRPGGSVRWNLMVRHRRRGQRVLSLLKSSPASGPSVSTATLRLG